jgi:uncharacterized protein (TIGR02217 family)
MGFHDDAIFPSQIAVDSTFGWGFQTAILTSKSGAEQRVARREMPQHVGDVSTGILDPEQLLELKAFHLARRGALYGFRFKDPLDHLSTDADPCDPNTQISHTDQVIGTGDGTTQSFQLIKTYVDGNHEYVRKITKPIDGENPVLIGLSTGGTTSQVAASDYTVDYSTGIVTLATAPGLDQNVTAGFEFHTPVRFEADADKAIEVAFQEFKYGRIPAIGIAEILEGGVASDEFWFGGSFTYSGPGTDTNGASTTILLSAQQGRYNNINFTSAGGRVMLPDANTVQPGGPHFYVHNTSANNSLEIHDKVSGSLATLPAGGSELRSVMCYYNPDLTPAGNIWVVLSN